MPCNGQRKGLESGEECRVLLVFGRVLARQALRCLFNQTRLGILYYYTTLHLIHCLDNYPCIHTYRSLDKRYATIIHIIL